MRCRQRFDRWKVRARWRIAGACLLLGVGGAAQAHTRLVTTEPRDGAVLATAPSTLRLAFSTPVEPGFSHLEWSAGGTWHALAPEVRGTRLSAPLPRLGSGRYRVRWSVMSRDGHRQRGGLVFIVR